MSAAAKTALSYVAVAGVAFLAFQIGLFDNLLSLFGIQRGKPPVQAPAAPAGPIPDQASPPSETAPPPQGAQSTPASPVAPGAAPQPTMPAAGTRVPGAGPPAVPEAEPKKVPPPQKKKRAAIWIFEGTVYDLITLKPVAGASLMFVSGNRDYPIETNSRGVYRVRLPAMRRGGYRLIVDHEEYLSDYFDEVRPPYYKRSLAYRSKLRALRPRNKPWIGHPQGKTRRNFALFPEIPDRDVPLPPAEESEE